MTPLMAPTHETLYRLECTAVAGTVRHDEGEHWYGCYVELVVPADRLNEWHTIYIDASGSRMAHPLTCELQTCRFHDEAMTWTEPPYWPGIYQWGPDLADWRRIE